MKNPELIFSLMQSGVLPALGCTEPGAVALAAAYAGSRLGGELPEKIEVSVDSNVYKNGVAVGVPGTGKVGLEIAAALGALIADPGLQLSVLSHITDERLLRANRLLEEKKVVIGLNDRQGLHIEVIVTVGENRVKSVISGGHTHLVLLEHNGEIIQQEAPSTAAATKNVFQSENICIADLINAVESFADDRFAFLERSIEMNLNAALIGQQKRLGMAIGANYLDLIQEGRLSDDLISYAKRLTASAADARMSGENIPVMSVAGSGNHGLTAIIPIVAVAERLGIERGRLHKALAVSSLVTFYIKSYTGNLSALCGCAVAAATGACAGVVWMLQGSQAQIDGAIKNMIANLTGMICDGGKVGCALKLSAAAGVAVETALLTLKNVLVPATNGIICDTADDTIRSLGLVSNPGMLMTDKVILDIMLEKNRDLA